MKFSAKNPALRIAAKRYGQVYETTTERTANNQRTTLNWISLRILTKKVLTKKQN